MSPNAPLTDKQRNAVTELRVMYNPATISLPPILSTEQRAQLPSPQSVPTDVDVQVEIAPPSPQPHPLLAATGVLKTPERVPVYFFTLRDDRAASESNATAEPANTRVIFCIHGGGNMVGHPTEPQNIQFYTQLLRGVAAKSANTKCVLIAPTYRLARIPENVFPAALQDLVAAYDHVLSKGYDAANIVIGGESAGGNHALVLTHLILHSDRTAPRGVLSIAPASIQAFDDLSDYAKTIGDKDLVGLLGYKMMGPLYVGASGVSLTDPLVSGTYLPFAPTWPKTLIIVGTSDTLIDGSRELERRLAALGRPVELVEYLERPHMWWALPHVFPENVQDAVERVARFVLQ